MSLTDKQKAIYSQHGLEYFSNNTDFLPRTAVGSVHLHESGSNPDVFVEAVDKRRRLDSFQKIVNNSFEFYVVETTPTGSEDVPELSTNEVLNLRYDGQILRDDADFYYIENGAARPIQKGAALDMLILKLGLQPFYNLNGAASDAGYDFGENVYALYNNRSYTRVPTSLIETFSPGDPFTLADLELSSEVYVYNISFDYNSQSLFSSGSITVPLTNNVVPNPDPVKFSFIISDNTQQDNITYSNVTLHNSRADQSPTGGPWRTTNRFSFVTAQQGLQMLITFSQSKNDRARFTIELPIGPNGDYKAWQTITTSDTSTQVIVPWSILRKIHKNYDNGSVIEIKITGIKRL